MLCAECGLTGHIEPNCRAYHRNKESGTVKPLIGTTEDGHQDSQRKQKRVRFSVYCKFCGKTSHENENCYLSRNKRYMYMLRGKYFRVRIRQVEENDSEEKDSEDVFSFVEGDRDPLINS